MEFDVWGPCVDRITDDEVILKSFDNVTDAIAYAEHNVRATVVLSNRTGQEHWAYWSNPLVD